MPCSPAAIIAASARYGFTSAPGSRFSTRLPCPCPTTRIEHVRLSFPHATAVHQLFRRRRLVCRGRAHLLPRGAAFGKASNPSEPPPLAVVRDHQRGKNRAGGGPRSLHVA